ncbi:MAG TPA: N-acetylmuramoyl-L-alanine amidase [Desulfurivibrionaceae bacterium]|nr:N-acetylmuramoyl-L-alanine amidase [Desulfurivibrionaceae bacterium]
MIESYETMDRKSSAPPTFHRLLLPILLFFCLGVSAVEAAKRPASPALPIAEQYRQAKDYYLHLPRSGSAANDRKSRLTAARKFRKIFQAAPNSDLAPSSLFMIARIYRELYSLHRNPLDLGEAIAYNEDVVSLYPQSRLADDALFNVAKLYLEERHDREKAGKVLDRLLKNYPNGDMAASAALLAGQTKSLQGTEKSDSAIPAKPTLLKTAAAPATLVPPAVLAPLRYWSTGNYTRVVIETSAPVTYREKLLEPTDDLPRRLYVDLDNCRVTPELQKLVNIDDGLLRQVRSGQYTANQVRVVLDTQSLADYKVFSLQDPFRIIIDVRGQQPGQPKPERNQADFTPSLAQQLGLGIRRIIIDPGHGGKDSGAIGEDGLQEKDITLAVGREVAARLRARLDCQVIMTRDRDIFIPLEERTAIANTSEGDLFISIHVNAAPNKKARGIETYILDLAKNKNAMQVAARENASSANQLSDLQSILRDLIQNSKKSESIKLAEYVQDSMVNGLKGSFPEVRNLGVKQAPFVVLLGAQMPAILTEIAFLSNPEDAAWLRTANFQNQVADQIVTGVTGYINDLSMAALR